MTTPVATPFDGDDVDWDDYGRLLDHLVAGGVDGVVPCGTTGEFASLTRDERRQVVERSVEMTPADVSVVPGGTGTSVAASVAWTETVADLGADAVVVTPPYFHTSNDPLGLRRFFERVADGSPLPVVVYNNPAFVGESIPVETVAELASHDSIVGLKDASGDVAYGVSAIDRTPEEFLVVQGFDSLLVASLRMGFDGGMNMLSNVLPGAFAEIVDSPASGRARELHREAVTPLFERGTEAGYAPVTKAALVERGIISSTDVRPPLVSVDTDRVADAVAEAEAAVS